MKNTFFKIFMLLTTFSAFTACEKVIDLPLETAEQRPVIDAVLDGNTGKCTVVLTKSGSFYETKAFEAIGGAQITLTNAAGAVFPVKETTKGIYVSDSLGVESGKTYTLTLKNVEGKTYKTTTTAPYAVKMGYTTRMRSPTLLIDTITRFFVGGVWSDPVANRHYYRLKVFVNDVLRTNDIALIDDQLSNGQVMSLQGFTAIQRGSKVRIELHSLDATSYEYFKQLNEVISSPDKVFNPKNNIGIDVFGCFSISFWDSRTLTL